MRYQWRWHLCGPTQLYWVSQINLPGWRQRSSSESEASCRFSKLTCRQSGPLRRSHNCPGNMATNNQKNSRSLKRGLQRLLPLSTENAPLTPDSWKFQAQRRIKWFRIGKHEMVPDKKTIFRAENKQIGWEKWRILENAFVIHTKWNM